MKTKKQRAIELRAEGKTFKEIGAELGCSAVYAHRLAGKHRPWWDAEKAWEMFHQGKSCQEISEAVGISMSRLYAVLGPWRKRVNPKVRS